MLPSPQLTHTWVAVHTLPSLKGVSQSLLNRFKRSVSYIDSELLGGGLHAQHFSGNYFQPLVLKIFSNFLLPETYTSLAIAHVDLCVKMFTLQYLK